MENTSSSYGRRGLGRSSMTSKEFPKRSWRTLLNSYNRDVLSKMLDDNHLIATHLFTAQPHIFVSKTNPLAKKEIVHLSDLEDFHTLAMTKEPITPSTSQEEILSQEHHKKSIVVSDRATLFNLLIGLDGRTPLRPGSSTAISTGITSSPIPLISKTRSSWSTSNMKKQPSQKWERNSSNTLLEEVKFDEIKYLSDPCSLRYFYCLQLRKDLADFPSITRSACLSCGILVLLMTTSFFPRKYWIKLAAG